MHKALRGFLYFLCIVLFLSGVAVSFVHPMIFFLVGLPLMVGSLAFIWRIRKSSQMTDMLHTLRKIEQNTSANTNRDTSEIGNV